MCCWLWGSEAYLEPSQTSKIKYFTKIINRTKRGVNFIDHFTEAMTVCPVSIGSSLLLFLIKYNPDHNVLAIYCVSAHVSFAASKSGLDNRLCIRVASRVAEGLKS